MNMFTQSTSEIRRVIMAVCLICCLWGGTKAEAGLLTITPDYQDVLLGENAQVEIWLSDLGPNLALGTFDLVLLFDPGIVSVDNLTFGDQLDLFGFGSIQSTDNAVGSLNVLELSFDSAADLLSLQLDDFMLFSVTFNTLALGQTSLLFDPSSLLGDQDYFAIDFTSSSAIINVVQAPEPESAWLLLSVLVMMLKPVRWRHRV